jgi:hypothetical protein
MRKLEEVKSELNFLTNRKKLISIVRSSIGWTSGEKTTDSTFKTNKIYQFQTNVGFAEKARLDDIENQAACLRVQSNR